MIKEELQKLNRIGEPDFYTLNVMASLCHTLAVEKGWYSDVETDAQFITRAVANLHGEISELWEAHRNGTLNLVCDKAAKMEEQALPALTCTEEELADIIIRVLDAAGRMNVDIGRAVAIKHAFNQTRPYRHGGKKA